MQKIKNSPLLIAFLILALGLCFSNAFAKSDDNEASSSQKNNQTSTSQNDNNINGAEHRSAVSNFVHTLLNTADREQGGIGEQVRVVAQQQNESEATTTIAINKIENRNKIKTFLFGSDYKNLGVLRSEIVQTRNRIDQLNRLMGQVENASSTAELQSQIDSLEQEQLKIDNFIKAQEGKFSLFGWLVKLFNK